MAAATAVDKAGVPAAAGGDDDAGSERYGKIEKLGEGTYGVVYKAVARRTQQLVALKKIRVDVWSEGVPATAMREISVLKEIRHHAVVDLKDIFVSYSGNLYLVFELMDGDLKDVLDEQRRFAHDVDKAVATGRDPASVARPIAQSTLPQNKYGLPLELTRAFVFQLLSGLHACHTHRVLHRDLKPHNLLVNKTGEMKLADFGLARPFAVPARRYTKEVVTLWYRAPEVLLGTREHLPALDIWSVGCIFAEMVTGSALFPGDSETNQVHRIVHGLGTPTEEIWPGCTSLPNWSESIPRCRGHTLAELVPNLPIAAADLLTGMLQYDPQRRITAHAALAHPFFDGLTIHQAHLVAKAALSNARMPPIPMACLSTTEAERAAALAHGFGAFPVPAGAPGAAFSASTTHPQPPPPPSAFAQQQQPQQQPQQQQGSSLGVVPPQPMPPATGTAAASSASSSSSSSSAAAAAAAAAVAGRAATRQNTAATLHMGDDDDDEEAW